MRARILIVGAMFVIATVPASSVWREHCARAEFENCVDHLRRLMPEKRATHAVAGDDAAWVARYEAACRDVESLVPAENVDTQYWAWLGCSERAGLPPATPYMWTPEHRRALERVVDVARPALDELVAVARERDRSDPVRTRPSMLLSRHHTNLLCAAAITAGSRPAAMKLLEDALDVSACIDDGSPIAGFLIATSAAEIGDAARILDGASVDGDSSACELEERLLACVDQRACALRSATDALEMVDRGMHREMDADELRSVCVLVRDLGDQLESVHAQPSSLRPTLPVPMALSMMWRRRDLDDVLISRLRFSTPLHSAPRSSG